MADSNLSTTVETVPRVARGQTFSSVRQLAPTWQLPRLQADPGTSPVKPPSPRKALPGRTASQAELFLLLAVECPLLARLGQAFAPGFPSEA
jgi:hypothetical protein